MRMSSHREIRAAADQSIKYYVGNSLRNTVLSFASADLIFFIIIRVFAPYVFLCVKIFFGKRYGNETSALACNKYWTNFTRLVH